MATVAVVETKGLRFRDDENAHISKLQNPMMKRKPMTYWNPLRRSNRVNQDHGRNDQAPGASSDHQNDSSANKGNAGPELAEVDYIDFSVFIPRDDVDIGKVDVPFDHQYDIDLDSAQLGDLGDIPSIFDTLELDMSRIKRIAPKKKKAKKKSKTSKSKGKAACSDKYPTSIPTEPPTPMSAPIPLGAPIPSGAPIPTGAPIPSVAPIPMAAPTPKARGPVPLAPIMSSTSECGNSVPLESPVAPSSRTSRVTFSDAKHQAHQFTGSSLLHHNQPSDDFVRPEDYDKTADINYDPDSLAAATSDEQHRLHKAGTVSKFKGLKSNRDVLSTTEQEEAHLSSAKGKVTKYSGLATSTRKIVTADEEEQQRIADQQVVKKQKSKFMTAGRESVAKRSSVQIDSAVTDAAKASKNKFKQMEKQNTSKDVMAPRKSTAKKKGKKKGKKKAKQSAKE